jgi:NifU-like protein
MSLAHLTRPSLWDLFSKKLKEKIERLRFGGYFTAKQAEEKGMRLVTGREGNVCLYWLVDEADGIIADAAFQAIGPPSLLAAAEIASELSLRKNYNQAGRISADLIDRHVRDKKEIPAFPPECGAHLNLILSCLDRAAYQCIDIPYAADYDETPIEWDGEGTGPISGWENLSQAQKIHVIEEVIDKEIRPYVELDAGGVKVLDLKDDKEVLISYEGSCTTCHSSTGSTLSAIQQILKTRVNPNLVVTPQL